MDSTSGSTAAPAHETSRPSAAEVLGWSLGMHQAGGDDPPGRIAAARRAAVSAGDEALLAATHYVETVWWLNRDVTRARDVVREGIVRATAVDLPVEAMTLRALALHLSEADAVERVDELATILGELDVCDDRRPVWAVRGYNVLGAIALQLDLPALATELFDRVLAYATDAGQTPLVDAITSNQLLVVVGELLWSTMRDVPGDEALRAIASRAVRSSELDERPVATLTMQQWTLRAQHDVLRVLVDPTRDSSSIEWILRSGGSYANAGEMHQLTRLLQAHSAIESGDLRAARAVLTAIAARADDRPHDRDHMISWLSARIAAVEGGARATEILDHAASAWRQVDAQRAVYLQSVRARISSAISARRRVELERQVLEDPLTGIGNRRAFEEADVDGTSSLVMVVDLDDFKAINDSRGHAVGDLVLERVARILREEMRAADAVCRVGGDEFVVVARGITPRIAERRAARVAQGVASLDWSGVSPGMRVSVSVGAAVGPGTRGELYQLADTALYAVKGRGGNDWRLVRGE